MTQTNSSQCPSPIHGGFNQDSWDFQVHAIQEQIVLASLPSVLYGVFVILIVASIHALTQQYGTLQPPMVALGLTLFALFATTTAYLVTMLLATQSTILNAILDSPSVIWGLPSNVVFGLLSSANPRDYDQIQNCTGTAALTINILLGDAIVCWRACVLWRGNRAIKTLCVSFLMTTFGLGMVDTVFTCAPSLEWKPDHHNVGTGVMYEGFSYGVAATVLTFGTNLLATVLVGYKAWKAKSDLRKYIVVGPIASQIEKIFALLLESGAAYCTLWAAVVILQVGLYQPLIALHTGSNTFWDIFGILVKGALVPLIAIYPTIIIVLVALNRSHVENGLLQTGETDSSQGAVLSAGFVDPILFSTQQYDSRSNPDEAILRADDDFGTEGEITPEHHWSKSLRQWETQPIWYTELSKP